MRSKPAIEAVSKPRFERLDPQRHDRKSFQCSETALEKYLKEQARKDQDSGACSVFVLTNDKASIIGYYTLTASSVLLTNLTPAISKRLPRYPSVPVTLLGRLAVHQAHAGQGHGSALLIDALRRASIVSTEVGSTAVIVDALHEHAARFYLKFGFEALPDQPLCLLLPMASIQTLI